jgi:hypothetical protein
MPCLLAVVALFLPRVVIVLTYLFSDWFVGVFETTLWPVLGFLVTPTFLLWYSVVANVYGGQWGFLQIAGGVIALVIDLSPASANRD